MSASRALASKATASKFTHAPPIRAAFYFEDHGMSADLGWKQPVLLATTANITLAGEQSIDGTTTSEDRVLVKNQTDTTQNGIYVSSSGAWARATDFDGPNDFTSGTMVLV